MNVLKKPTSVLVLVCAALVATVVAVAAAEAPPFPQRATAAEAPRSSSPIRGGPGGRTPLADWTLRTDTDHGGAARGWQRGGFSGASVSVPDDVNPRAYSGSAGVRNYEGSVAWY